MENNTLIPEGLKTFTDEMQRTGIRRLLLLSGSNDWSSQCVQHLVRRLPGDWLWVGESPELPSHCVASALKTLLGREFHHAVFDARMGIDAAALAALAGTLSAGSWLVLLVPEWSQWALLPDADASRFSECATPFPTPNFITHLQSCVLNDPDTLVWYEGRKFVLPYMVNRKSWLPANGQPLQDQEQILANLDTIQKGVAVVTAPRGRGKSTLAGLLIKATGQDCLVTGPTKAATNILAQYAGEYFHFMAPDAILAQPVTHHYSWLIVDEAAAIPAPLLRNIISGFSRVLLTTTVQGYEGTGRGFLLKLCASLPDIKYFSLNKPVRWADACPLERIIDDIMLFSESNSTLDIAASSYQYTVLTRIDWPTHQPLFANMYRLLCAAHYRTSPLDWRRMLDAPDQTFLVAQINEQCAGAVWLTKEGGLSNSLSHQVWAGIRRPAGNLVAQSLAAHGGNPDAATLKSLRISRIAIHPDAQRQGLGSELIHRVKEEVAHQYDYLSVSFGYTAELGAFWQQCGFTFVRIGTRLETSSGCYNVMALLPLSEAGDALLARERLRLIRDYPWLALWRKNTFSDVPILEMTSPEETQRLDTADWYELAGFVFAHRPLEACLGALNRLLLTSQQPLLLMRGRLVEHLTPSELGKRYHLNGKKALLAAMRVEVGDALQHLDAEYTDILRQKIHKITV